MDYTADLRDLSEQMYTIQRITDTLQRDMKRDLQTHFVEGILNPIRQFPDLPAPFFVITPVLDHVTHHLTFHDLLRLRLVCRTMNKEVSEILSARRSLVVAYEECPAFFELMEERPNKKLIQISSLCVLDLDIATNIIPKVLAVFSNYLSQIKLDQRIPAPSNFGKLLEKIPHLEVLVVNLTNSPTRSVNRNISSKLDKLSTHLCNRGISFSRIKRLSWTEAAPVTYFDKLLTTFPRLETIQIPYWSTLNVQQLHIGQVDSIRKLSVSCVHDFLNQFFLVLAYLQLKLRTLVLSDVPPCGRQILDPFKSFLESVSGTVDELQLIGTGFFDSCMIPTPNTYGIGYAHKDYSLSCIAPSRTPFPLAFPKLTKMEIDCKLFTSLPFLDGMPMLKTLICNFGDIGGWCSVLNTHDQTKIYPNIQEISVGLIQHCCLDILLPIFPGLTTLSLSEDQFDDNCFISICTNSPQLRHLKIIEQVGKDDIFPTMTDFCLTGLSRKTRERLLAKGMEQDKLIKKRGTRPYVGNLKLLQSLELASLSSSDISDAGILFGIKDLKHLVKLTLPQSKITITGLNAIVSMNTLKALEFFNDPLFDPQQIRDLKNKRLDMIMHLYNNLKSRILD